jgi:hypothetical protein
MISNLLEVVGGALVIAGLALLAAIGYTLGDRK